jgi:hypothetical protein
MQAYSESKRVPKGLITNSFDDAINLCLAAFQESFRLIVCSGVAYQVERRQPCLPSRRYKNQGGLFWRVFFDRSKTRLIHGGHSWTIVATAEPLSVNLNWNWSNRAAEVVQATHRTGVSIPINTDPICQIFRIRKRGRKGNDSGGFYWILAIRQFLLLQEESRNESSPADDCF